MSAGSRFWKAHPLLIVWALIAAVALTGPAAAWSHNGKPHKRMIERKLHRLEKRVLGRAHAREHRLSRIQARRERARWLKLSPAKRRKLLVASAAAAGDPATEGRWTAPFAMPAIATHAAVLPTGKVMFFSQKVNDYKGDEAAAYLWDPTKAPGQAGEFKSVTPPANIWCGAQSLMADGQLLVTGGTPRVRVLDVRVEGHEDGLHVRSLDGDLDPAARHGPGTVVSDADAAAGRAHAHHLGHR